MSASPHPKFSQSWLNMDNTKEAKDSSTWSSILQAINSTCKDGFQMRFGSVHLHSGTLIEGHLVHYVLKWTMCMCLILKESKKYGMLGIRIYKT